MMNNDSLATELYSAILNDDSKYENSVIERADFYFAKSELKNGNISKMNDFIDSYKDSDKVVDAYSDIGDIKMRPTPISLGHIHPTLT